jgi:hypothetical protein
MTAIRLTFDVVGGKPTYRSATHVNMRTPRSQVIGNVDKASGVWIELRDGDGTALYRQVVDVATFRADTEIPTGTSDRPLRRVPSLTARSVYAAVIPDDPRAKSFHILERPPGSRSKKPTELARVSLEDLDPNHQGR